jgi:hypothetical protein
MFRQDRLMHFTIGFIIGFTLSIISAIFKLFTQPTLGLVCLLSAFIVGLFKELFDKYYQKEKFDWLDFIMTILGGSLFFFA